MSARFCFFERLLQLRFPSYLHGASFQRDSKPVSQSRCFPTEVSSLEKSFRCMLICAPGSAAGSDTLLLSPPGSDVSLIQYRLIGGTLDLYFFSGPTPQNVVEQYGQLIGTPTWQPAWAFGFHLCRWGYTSVNETKAQVQKMREANIPLEGERHN